ncbi:rhamnulokinase [Friedmanniella luteola]|uniref:Rhamnulokinase n=1 Tax=Friedmanniella luteola TaxID=546871 RepID=A0A1H1ZC62_9ACTN|nr:rhamnulokinase family protein [Friedmanniella luteola]SDT31308.1 rhamnulokinase [Friedmanniella luteola]
MTVVPPPEPVAPRPEPVEGPSTGSAHRPAVFGAIDIGASSGRVVAGVLDDDGLRLEVVHRFPNGATEVDGHLRWDLSGLFAEVLTGLAALAARHPGVRSVGIDTWAVDYGLLDADGHLLAQPVAYRDDRTDAVVDLVHRRVDPARLYAVTGLQFLPFNTLYQLSAERQGPLWPRVAQALLLPDLLAYWLTGERRTEATNASTTGLLDAGTRTWSRELLEALGLPLELFPPLVQPGETLGPLLPEVAARTGLAPGTTVVAVGSHDTASAVVGVPAEGRSFAYVSSGTWSLVGLELDAPVLTPASRAANFTNEGGVDGRTRYLRNEGGLWLLQESLRSWAGAGEPVDQDALLAEAAALPPGGPTFDVDAPDLIAPGDMPARIRRAVAASGQELPGAPAAVARSILDSLAVAYARTTAEAEALAGQTVDVVHVVGGGSRNALLCQLTADLSGRLVLSGPVEATALGNLAVQARAAGLLPADLESLRRTLRRGLTLATYTPTTTGRAARLSSSVTSSPGGRPAPVHRGG